jgi:hypothetical protein
VVCEEEYMSVNDRVEQAEVDAQRSLCEVKSV